MIEIVEFLLLTVAIKAIVIGSDFNFYRYIKNGRKYWGWYTNRQTFKQFLAAE